MAKKKGGKNRPGQGPKRVSNTPPPGSTEPSDAPETPPPSEDEPKPDVVEEESAPPPPQSGPRSHAEEPLHKAAWGAPFVKIDQWWTWFELRLLLVVLIGLVVSMVFWVALHGMSTPVESDSKAGVVFRAVIGALVLGVGATWGCGKAKLGTGVRIAAGAAGMLLGVLLAPQWRGVGVVYFGNVENWLQEGSSFAMFGQLRGVSTRLTVLLAFIGGSLAAASGKHINIDVALRFIPKQLKLPVFIVQSLATIMVCFVAAWGFFDYIAISNFNAAPELTAKEKYDIVDKAVSQDMFLLRKQIGFDLKATPYILRGKSVNPETDPEHPNGAKWDDERGFNGRQWNEYLETSGYRDYFTPEEVAALKSPPDYLDESRLPLAIGPEGQPRNQLVRTMNLTFSAGFIVMALRFLLRLILVVSGHSRMHAEAEFEGAEHEAPMKKGAL